MFSSSSFFLTRLYNLKQSDSGYYICNAGNTLGRTRDYVYIEISPKTGDSNQQQPDYNDREREQQEREREQQEREREREQQEREREREQNRDQTTPPVDSKNQKPLVIINSLFNGQPIELGADVKLVCMVNGN